jgi:hypothetical protein
MTRTLIAAALLALVTSGAKAEQRTYYGSDGKVTARSVTGSNGAITVYGRDGRVVSREATGSNGTTTFYGADGGVVGKATSSRAR